MADGNQGFGPSEWDWFAEEFSSGVNAIFARGLTPERVCEAFGVDPADARLVTQDGAMEDPGYPWLRVGRTGDWAFAVDLGCADVDEHDRIAAELSAGTEVAMLEVNASLDNFSYIRDGVNVTWFEGLLAYNRAGTEPDRFLPLMRQAGLMTDPEDDWDEGAYRDPVIGTLELLTLAFGIRLTAERALGPLLTSQPQLGGPALMDQEDPGEPLTIATATVRVSVPLRRQSPG